ncbi:MAG: inositol monophosphatase, partial [Bacteroidetes bacterium]
DDIEVEEKEGGENYASQVVTGIDRASERAILARLRPSCDTFDLALLSEETPDDGSRLEKDYFWCIDPIDGTLPFIEKRLGFSVFIALVARDGTPQIEVVFDPSSGTLYHAAKGMGAFRNRHRWSVNRTNDHLTYVTGKKLADTPRANEIEQLLQAQPQALGLGEGFLQPRRG